MQAVDVATAEAQYKAAVAREKFLKAKAKWLADKTSANKAAYQKAADEFQALRDDFKLNFRVAPDGPGDATVQPEPVKAGTKKASK